MSLLKVALLGAGGQLGKTMRADWQETSANRASLSAGREQQGSAAAEKSSSEPGDVQLHAFTRAELDIRDPAQLQERLSVLNPQVIINAAAYTRVDAAESDQEAALQVNRDAVRNVAEFAAAANCRLIHLSTDFVFDGSASRPYQPGDPTGPVNVYGATKLAGEQVIQQTCPDRAVIVRTSWLYSRYQANFMTTMLQLMQEKDSLGIVTDQVGTPTSTRSLSRFIARLVNSERREGGNRDGGNGRGTGAGTETETESESESESESGKSIYHWSDAGVASWYDFAVAIQEEALAAGLLKTAIPIRPIPTSDYPTPAPRPGFSVLDKSVSYRDFHLQPVHWRQELRRVLESMMD